MVTAARMPGPKTRLTATRLAARPYRPAFL